MKKELTSAVSRIKIVSASCLSRKHHCPPSSQLSPLQNLKLNFQSTLLLLIQNWSSQNFITLKHQIKIQIKQQQKLWVTWFPEITVFMCFGGGVMKVEVCLFGLISNINSVSKKSLTAPLIVTFSIKKQHISGLVLMNEPYWTYCWGCGCT